MSAVGTVEALLRLGVTVKDAYANASVTGSVDWKAFLQMDAYKAVAGDVNGLLAELRPDRIKAALDVVQLKKRALLGGQPVSAVSSEKLTQYFALLDAEGLLVNEELKNASATPTFLSWVVSRAAPTLVSIAKVVIPLLL